MSVGYRHGEFVGVGEIATMRPLYEAHRDWRALRRALTNQRGVDGDPRDFWGEGEVGALVRLMRRTKAQLAAPPSDFDQITWHWPRFVVRYRPFDWERDS